jgi:hypothetical protein
MQKHNFFHFFSNSDHKFKGFWDKRKLMRIATGKSVYEKKREEYN